MLLAAVFLLLLFALKSLSIFIYCGILFIAVGILFPLPLALLVSLLGASGIHYGKYLLGSIAGMLLTIITFPVIGSRITDPTSPLFLASVVIQAAVTVVSVTWCAVYLKKKNRNP